MSPAEGVRFAEIQRVLALFTQGLTGRRLHLKPREARSADVRVHSVEIDGANLHLPAEIANFASARYNRGAYRIVLLHQIGYLENGTYEFDLQTAATQMRLPPTPRQSAANHFPRRLRRPLVADLERFLSGGHRPALLRRVFITLEDLRIDTAMRARYPGACADLDRVLAHALASRPPLAARRRLSGLIEALVQYTLGAEPSVLLANDDTGLLAPILEKAQDLLHSSASVYDSARCALAVCALLEGLFRRLPSERGDDSVSPAAPSALAEGAAAEQAGAPSGDEEEGDADAADEEFDVPGVEFRGELRPDRIRRHSRSGSGGGQTPEADPATAEEPPQTAAQGEDRDAQLPGAPRRATARRPVQDGPLSFYYDEWDCHAQSYLKAWCRVYEHRLRGEDFDFIAAARRRNALLAGRVKRQFSFIKSESWHRVHRASDGDELELDAVIDAVIDRKSGHATDEHLYVRRDRGLREVAAAFLVDTSASTDFPIPDSGPMPAAEQAEQDLYLWGRANAPVDLRPSAPKRRVIDVAKEALALMCDALDRLGDSHAVYGFSGDGRENVEFNVIKDFGDRLSARTWAALAAMEPRRSTRMGPAIRHATAKLMRQPLRRKVLIIVSDGYPEDRDYGPDRRDREYGILDTARALEEAARAGVSTFCITIDPAGNDYLRRMCEEHRYLVIDDVAALPAELTKVYRTLTRSVGATR